MKLKNNTVLKCLAVAILPVAAVAVLGLILTDTQSQWYLALNKPAIQPPAIVFPIAWNIWYVLLGISLYFSCQSGVLGTNRNLQVYYILSGVLNVLWSLVFFRLQNPSLAFFVVLAYFVVTALLFFELDEVNKWVRWLILPYLIWIGYAAVINYVIVMIN